MAVCDEARVGIELELHGTAGTLTRVLLAHVISLSTTALKTISKIRQLDNLLYSNCEARLD
jgi:hypothetical protein